MMIPKVAKIGNLDGFKKSEVGGLKSDKEKISDTSQSLKTPLRSTLNSDFRPLTSDVRLPTSKNSYLYATNYYT